MTQPLAVHRTILVVDVEGFGDIRRTNANQLAVRAGLYESLEQAFGRAGISWEGCDREDRGDGVFILVPPGVAKGLFVESLPGALAGALRVHNEAHPPQERIRLRMALHAGEVNYDPHGVTAASVNLAFRLLDAPALKAALAGTPGVLALIVSSWFFDEVVRHSQLCNPAAYRPVNVAVKETAAAAWMCLPDLPFPQDGPVPGVALVGRPAVGPGDLPGQVADQFAAAVGAQWQAEAAVRRLNDPYPLPVRWVAADPALVDDWPTLVTLAASGAGWPPRSAAGGWAAGPGSLAGEGAQLVHVLARVPTGRLVVLGEPGAGKTVLMVRLVLDLLAGRASGDPVPVLVPAASWDPARQDLRGWLEARLSTDYPWLAGPAAVGGGRATRIRALLDRGLIMPILDGLDEIRAAARGPAIAKINDAIRPGERLVVTSRVTEWRQAVRPPAGREVRLRAAAGISLCPLDARAVARYLRADAGGPAAAARWDPVLAALDTQPLLARVFSSPLMVGLARIIYNPRPGEHPAALPDPVGLCANPAAGTHLFDAFIPAAYSTGRRGRLGRSGASPQQAGKWLAFLARHLEHSVKTPDFAWWQLARSLTQIWPYVFVLPFGVLPGQTLAILLGIPGAATGAWGGWLVLWLWMGTLYGEQQPSYGFSWAALLRRMGVGNLVVLAVLVAALAAGLAFAHAGLVKVMLWIGLSSFIQAMVTENLKGGAPGKLVVAPSPKAVLIRDRRAGLVVMVSAMLLGVLLAAVREEKGSGLVYVIAGVMAGGLVGLGVGAGFSGLVSAWLRWVHARAWFALQRRLPWRLMAFLADAHERGVLRQDGAVYQFRHLELQHWLARRPPPRLASVAGKLAAAVQGQWQAEAKVRGIGDQQMLPVRWAPTDPSLVDGWDDLVTVATSGAGRAPPRAADAWADGPHELAGQGGQLAAVLDRVPTGRLVVLGEPGAGKTTLMIRLVLALLARRTSADPVPVLFPAAAWDPARQDLREWLTSQLVLGYPALARPAPPGAEGPTRAAALLGDGLIMAILDGLDEIPAAARGLAITKINDGLRSGQRLVVTSRTEPWRQAVQPPGGARARLSGAAGVQLCPLDTSTVVEYLRAGAGGQAGAARWAPVIAALGTPGPLRQALSSPLLAALARIVYDASDGADAGSPGPGGLCALTDLAAVENHLFDGFIAAAYRPRPGRRARHRHRAGQAERWLMFLAHHLEHTINSPGFAWWQLSNAAPRRPLAGVAGFTSGLALGLAVGLARGPLWGLGAALLATATGTFAGAFVDQFAGADIKQPFSDWWRYRSSPAATLREARGAALAAAAGIAGLSLFAGELARLSFGVPTGVLTGLLALGFMNVGYCRNPAMAAWPKWLMGRAWLARRRLLPWRLMAFLTDAHRRGVLTQTGTIYQFRHIELQHRLASRMSTLTTPRRRARHLWLS